MKIHVWDNCGTTCDRYTVFIDNQVFLMSYYADRANEVDQYAGMLDSVDDMNRAMVEIGCKCVKIPKTLKYAIRQRILQIRHGE